VFTGMHKDVSSQYLTISFHNQCKKEIYFLLQTTMPVGSGIEEFIVHCYETSVYARRESRLPRMAMSYRAKKPQAFTY
jgi:hypothetical protein